MKRQPPPLRFLLLVGGGWLCMRTAAYAPGWWVEEFAAAPVRAEAAERRLAARGTAAAPAAVAAAAQAAAAASAPATELRGWTFQLTALPASRATAARGPHAGSRPPPVLAAMLPPPLLPLWPPTGAVPGELRSEPAPPGIPLPGRTAAAPGRWSGSAWMLVRSGDAPALASGGTLGGSQAGLRLGYRLNGDGARPLTVTARLYAPLRDRRASEAALGLDWRPDARLPVHLTLERRQALGPRGRSAFALAAHGGLSERLPAGVRLDAYGQAGIVGTRSRDIFADASARASRPLGRIELGAAIWGGAQPGAARLDAGPSLTLRLPEARLRISAEYRFRLAGDASPGSGPALTIGSDF